MPEEVLDHWLAQCLDLRRRLVRLTDEFDLPLWSPDIEVSPHPRGTRMLTLPEVERLVGMKKTFIDNRIGEEPFPRPAPLGPMVRRWARHEIDSWIDERNDGLRVLLRADSPWELRPDRSTLSL